MPNPTRDKMKARTGGENGPHLWPRLVQKIAEGKTSHELSWKVKLMIYIYYVYFFKLKVESWTTIFQQQKKKPGFNFYNKKREPSKKKREAGFQLVNHGVFQVGNLWGALLPVSEPAQSRQERRYLKVSVIGKKFGARSGEEDKRKYEVCLYINTVLSVFACRRRHI